MFGINQLGEVVQPSADADVLEGKRKKGGGFQTMGLGKNLLKGVLQMGYNVPTPIQRKAVPPMMERCDVVAMARTGSGKTAAFVIPLLHHLEEHSKVFGIRAIMLAPTREIALQTWRHCTKIGRYLTVRACPIVGGNSINAQFAELASNPDIVIATPGRLLHLIEESSMQLTRINHVVLDEGDRLFEMGFQPQILALLHKVPDSCQRALFSATMPSVLVEFASAGLHNPAIIRLDSETKVSELLKQSAFVCRTDEKDGALIFLIKSVIGIGQNQWVKSQLQRKEKLGAKTSIPQCLVFVESKHHVEYLEVLLERYGILVNAVHGQMDQEARRIAVQKFTARQTQVMVVTDVAARGIDIPMLDYVINYSFPPVPKLFVHRVGRVARAGRAGFAFSILTPEDFPYYCALMSFMNRKVISVSDDFMHPADDGCYGRIPEDRLQLEVDFIQRLKKEDSGVESMAKVVGNAHKKFVRSKQRTGNEAVMEAKLLCKYDEIPLHPLFVSNQTQETIDADAAIRGLRKFKAKETVLDMVHHTKVFQPTERVSVQNLMREQKNEEMDKAANDNENAIPSSGGFMFIKGKQKRGGIAQSAPTKKFSLAESMMLQARKRKRECLDEPVEEVLEGFTRTKRYQDPDFYVKDEADVPVEAAQYSIKDATLDLTAESAQDAHQQRNVYAWNKQKNRYQKMHVNDAKAMLKGMKNEAGKKINFKSKLDTYSKWTKTSNLRIQDVGEEEDSGQVTRARAAAKAARQKNAEAEEEADPNDPDTVDISNPNQGKKLKVGRKIKRLPQGGKVRNFDEMLHVKKRKEKEAKKLEKKRVRKGAGKGKKK